MHNFKNLLKLIKFFLNCKSLFIFLLILFKNQQLNNKMTIFLHELKKFIYVVINIIYEQDNLAENVLL